MPIQHPSKRGSGYFQELKSDKMPWGNDDKDKKSGNPAAKPSGWSACWNKPEKPKVIEDIVQDPANQDLIPDDKTASEETEYIIHKGGETKYDGK